MELSHRQCQLLRALVHEHSQTGRPVPSRVLAALANVDARPSTVRLELERLESQGLLCHPHTSAGRVPTDRGYRIYVDTLMSQPGEPERSIRLPLPAQDARLEIESALSDTTQRLAQSTHLLALVSAPPAARAVIRHVEVLLLNPLHLVVVCITTSGDVTKHSILLDEPADPGLVDWAGSYLNEQIAGMALGQNLLRKRLENPELSPPERRMLTQLAPAFTDLVERAERVYIEGAAHLVDELSSDVAQISDLLRMLEERKRLLDAVKNAVGRKRIGMRIGSENEMPELQPVSLVAARYGLGSDAPLGMIGLIGPRNMDYPTAVAAVRSASENLTLLFSEGYGR